MGTILEFRRSEDAIDAVARPVEALGEIIIFPGVRIDRRTPIDMPEHTRLTPSRRQRGRKK